MTDNVGGQVAAKQRRHIRDRPRRRPLARLIFYLEDCLRIRRLRREDYRQPAADAHPPQPLSDGPRQGTVSRLRDVGYPDARRVHLRPCSHRGDDGQMPLQGVVYQECLGTEGIDGIDHEVVVCRVEQQQLRTSISKSGLMSLSRAAITSALGLPSVECSAGSWRLRLLRLTTSASTNVIRPTPARAISSAA